MKEIDNTPIESFDQDWGDPDGTGKKAKSLEQVQAFLKKEMMKGYTFLGTIKTTDTPITLTSNDKVFYIATEEGDYTNYGLGTISELSLIKSLNGSWSVEGLGVPFSITKDLYGSVTYEKIEHDKLRESTYFNFGTNTPTTFSWNTSASTSTAITDLTTFRTEIPANTKFYVRGEGKASPRQRMFIIGAEDGTVLADSINFYQNCNRDDLFGPYQFDVKCKVFMQVLSPYDEEFDGVFVEEEGNGLINKIDDLNNRITEIEENNIGNSQCTGKKMVSIGDSLSTSGIWQNRLAELTGLVFSQEDNMDTLHPLSVGGTSMYGRKKDMGLVRIKNIKELDYAPDVIFLENVNDKSAFTTSGAPIPDKCGTIEDPAYIVNNIIDDNISEDAWNTNPADVLSSISTDKRSLGSMLMLTRVTSGKNIAISSLPTSDGVITLNLKHGGLDHDYAIPVTAGESRDSIIEKILEYDYINISDTISDDGQSVDFYEETGVAIRAFYDAGNTGIVLNITDTDNAKSMVAVFFDGNSIDEWEDSSKWIDIIPLYRAWKGIIEYCQREFPESKIFIVGLESRGGFNPETSDMSAYHDHLKRQKSLLEALREIAKYYSVTYLDVAHNDSISAANLLEFYPMGSSGISAHPYKNGYIRWGEVIASMI